MENALGCQEVWEQKNDEVVGPEAGVHATELRDPACKVDVNVRNGKTRLATYSGLQESERGSRRRGPLFRG